MPSLPTHPPLIGRQTELAELSRLLAEPECQLLTLFGLGGSGKTRLAVQAAAQAAASFPEGAYFVDLEPVDGPEALVLAIANALPLAGLGQADPRGHLLAYLRDKRLLLLLDNCEHLLEPGPAVTPGAPGLISDLIRAAPHLKVLVTSRIALNLHAEWRFAVQGLAYPRGEGDDLERFAAVQLFVERARRMRPGFSLASLPPAERAGLAHLCRLVEGLPLALELAAGWTKTLSCAAIAAELAERLDWLTSSAGDLPVRQRSVQAVCEQAWQRLSEAEQSVLGRLAVMHGSFSREAAQAVAGATLPTLLAWPIAPCCRPPATIATTCTSCCVSSWRGSSRSSRRPRLLRRRARRTAATFPAAWPSAAA